MRKGFSQNVKLGKGGIMSSWEVLESDVDYVTISAHEQDKRSSLARIANELAQESVNDAEKVVPFHFHNYVGQASPRFAYGENREWSILRVYGRCASERFCEVVSVADRITRLDIQVTARHDKDIPQLAISAYRECLRVRRERMTIPEPTLITTPDSGDTLYVGRRTSDVFLRLYDKGREDPDHYDLGSWRWEVELKSDVANAIARTLARFNNTAKAVAVHVLYYYRGRGIPVPFETDVAAPKLPPRKDDGNVERTFRWLATTVAPAVLRLQSHYTLSDICGQIGLEELIVPARALANTSADVSPE